jgi:hypothetical protein
VGGPFTALRSSHVGRQLPDARFDCFGISAPRFPLRTVDRRFTSCWLLSLWPSSLISATCRGCFHTVDPWVAPGRCRGVLIPALTRRIFRTSASVHGDVAACELIDVCVTVWSESTLMALWRAGVCTLLDIIAATRRFVRSARRRQFRTRNLQCRIDSARSRGSWHVCAA